MTSFVPAKLDETSFLDDRVVISGRSDGLRLDVFLANHYHAYSRNEIQKFITSKMVRVNKHPKRASYRLAITDIIEVHFPRKVPFHHIPHSFSLTILYEDDDLLLLYKPAGMVMYPVKGNLEKTMMNCLAALYHDDFMPVPVHRLDKPVSGVVVVACSKIAASKLSHLFSVRKVQKVYLAIVDGHFSENDGILVNHLKEQSGAENSQKIQEAVTHFSVLAEYHNFSIVQLRPKTGRYHQLRKQCALAGVPIVGDTTYGSKYPIHNRILLHSWQVSFEHPLKKEITVYGSAPPDEHFKNLFREKIITSDSP